jgi:transposase-like protein
MNQSSQTDKNDDLGKGTKQTRKDRAILALLQYPTIEKAAAALNIHPSTLYRWLKQPDFKDKYIEARAAGFEQSLARLQLAAPAAATRLLRFIANDATPAGSSIRACDAILKHAERGFQLDVIEARLRKLEKHYRSREDRSES